MNTGIIPGNRNADNIDEALEQFDLLLYPSRSIHTDGIRAALIKSFGFGQVGVEALLIHPNYLLSCLDPAEYEAYRQRRQLREQASHRHTYEAMIGRAPYIRIKDRAPYARGEESTVYLNPRARTSYDEAAGTWLFSSKIPDQSPSGMLEALQRMSPSAGVDVQLIEEVNWGDEAFLERNFTAHELSYCRMQPNPHASLAGLWAAKEACIKALCSAQGQRPSWLAGPGASLKAIEIQRGPSGEPLVKLPFAGQVQVTISHSGAYAVAVAHVK